jgi:hypothetical protein
VKHKYKHAFNKQYPGLKFSRSLQNEKLFEVTKMKNTYENLFGKNFNAAVLIMTVLMLTGWLVFKESAKISNKEMNLPAAKTQNAEFRADEAYGKLPLAFESNQGQIDSQVKFAARGDGYNLWLTGDGATLRLNNQKTDAANQADILQLRLSNANRQTKVSGETQLEGKANYFSGGDASKWRTDIPLYSKVKYSGVYDGIDLVYYGNQQQLEYDFVLQPNADPQNIKIRFNGAEKVSIDESGELILSASGGDVRWHKPVSYQETDGIREEVASRYVLNDKNEIGFELGEYDRSKSLTIDPTLGYSTYFSANNSNLTTYNIKVDGSGNAYVSGTIRVGSPAASLPTTSSAYKTSMTCTAGGTCSAYFVTKFNPTGTALIYSTYIGEVGSNSPGDLAIDSSGNAYITGYVGFSGATPTDPTNFPTTAGAYQPNFHGSRDAFVTKLSAAGNALVFSTFLGGRYDDTGSQIALDGNNNVYVFGAAYGYRFDNPVSFDFPVTPGTIDTTNHVNQCFLAKLSSAGSSLVYSTLIFADFSTHSQKLAVDNPGNAYIFFGAYPDPNGFPTTANAFQQNRPVQADPDDGQYDTMLTKINPTATQTLYSTYIAGGRRDFPGGIAVDNSGKVYLKGITGSTNFPTTPNAFRTVSNAGTSTNTDNDGFVSVIDTNASGAASLVYSTYLGGTKPDSDFSDADTGAIAADSAGNIWITGSTQSDNFPTTPDALQQSQTGNFDRHTFISKINPHLSGNASLVYSTYFGNFINSRGYDIAVDGRKNVYVTGVADGGLPTTAGAFQTTPANGFGSYIAKFSTAPSTAFDFDGDSKTDISIFRPSVGEWWYLKSSTLGNFALQFGQSSDKLAPGDFTGDGKTDIAFFRPSTGFWYILRSEDLSFFSFPFGANGDIPAPADYDGDGKSDAAVFRPSDSTWYIRRSSDLGTTIVTFGSAGDKPVPADYDGDGKSDIAIFRPSDGSWWYLQSSNLQFSVYRFGVSSDKPVQGDYTGDGKADIAVFRPSTGEWFIQRSEDNSFFSFPFGAVGDIPSPGDYDGDGQMDAAIFRPANSTWFLRQSTAGVGILTFGISGDRPVPNAFVP